MQEPLVHNLMGCKSSVQNLMGKSVVQKLTQEAAVCASPSTEDGPVQNLKG